jgi:hypothetical protein
VLVLPLPLHPLHCRCRLQQLLLLQSCPQARRPPWPCRCRLLLLPPHRPLPPQLLPCRRRCLLLLLQARCWCWRLSWPSGPCAWGSVGPW